jgi:hypothetical protein
VFSRMRNITFVENGPIQLKGRCCVACVRESIMFEARGLAPCFAVGIEFAVSRNTAYLSAFSWVRNMNFVPISPFQVSGETL